MSTTNELVPALARTRQLVELYQDRVITSVALIGEVAELVGPDNIEEVISLLPTAVKAQLLEWARRLPMPDAPGIVCWPLPPKTTLAFKEWLRRQDEGNVEDRMCK